MNPDGVIISKRAWSHPGQVRNELEKHVGPVDPITREEDVHLKISVPPRTNAQHGIVARIARPEMQPIRMQPQVDSKTLPFFAKLRAEADANLLRRGTGKLYLGFHPDPFHNAHWNNLTTPLSFAIERADGVELDQWKASAARVDVTSDTDPREFLLEVSAWPEGQPLKLTVQYFACVGEISCHAVKQTYVVHRQRDPDGGNAKGEGAGFWDSKDFARRMMAGDRDNDRKLMKSETAGIILPHFEKLDTNKDGFLELHELRRVSDWLNGHHQPGTP